MIVENAFDLIDDQSSESALRAATLGPLVADAIRWGSGPETDAALTTAGLIRDDVRRGESRLQQTSDLFRVLGLGIGSIDRSPGYPIARFWVTPRELKSLLEAMLLIPGLRGANHYPYFSGLRFRHNPGVCLSTGCSRSSSATPLGGYRELDLDDGRLVSVATNAYILSFLGLIEKASYGLLEVTLKDAVGEVIDPADALIDADPELPGVQESKEWLALIRFAQSFPDGDGDGIPDVPERYRTAEQRMIVVGSLDQRLLLRNATALMWVPTPALLGLTAGLAWLAVRRWRRV